MWFFKLIIAWYFGGLLKTTSSFKFENNLKHFQSHREQREKHKDVFPSRGPQDTVSPPNTLIRGSKADGSPWAVFVQAWTRGTCLLYEPTVFSPRSDRCPRSSLCKEGICPWVASILCSVTVTWESSSSFVTEQGVRWFCGLCVSVSLPFGWIKLRQLGQKAMDMRPSWYCACLAVILFFFLVVWLSQQWGGGQGFS